MMEEVQAGIVEDHMKRMERMGQQGSDQKSTWSENSHPVDEMTRYRDQVLRVIIEAKTQKRAPRTSDHWKSPNQSNQ